VMRVGVVIAVAALTAGCTSAEQTACETAIKDTLKAPSTFKLIKKESIRYEYDASNPMGVPMRGTGVCIYDARTKKANWIEDSRD
jgi:hypothetical protein